MSLIVVYTIGNRCMLQEGMKNEIIASRGQAF